MFQSFTGNSRKPRQVNLSGQTTSARSNLPGAQRSNAGTTAGQGAIALAQAQRLQRVHDRERLNASRLLQRSWRGHASRKKTRQQWRTEWDQHELARANPQVSDVECLLRGKQEDRVTIPPYGSAEEWYLQISLLLHFLEVKLKMDRARLIYFGEALRMTLTELTSIATENTWSPQLHRFLKATIEALDSSENDPGSIGQSESLLSLVLFLSKLKPEYIVRNAKRYYSVLGRLVARHEKYSRMLDGQLEKAILAPLIPTTADTLAAYIAFGTELLTAPETLARIEAAKLIAPKLDFAVLTIALDRVLETDHNTRTRILGDKDHSLWLLAHLIFLHSELPNAIGHDRVGQETGYIKVLSTLLVAQRSEISSRIDILDQPMADVTNRAEDQSEEISSTPLPRFVREQILKLSERTSIIGILTQIELASSSDQNRGFEQAQVLATYALTLIGVFPRTRADKIRMWLCAGSVNVNPSTRVSAMLYFWRYCRSSGIFQKIHEDYHKAIPLVRFFLGLEGSVTRQSVQSTQKEWKMLLLFLELYSFAIGNVGDEQFFASREFETHNLTLSSATSKDISPTLGALGNLVTFLKNLAFALYWHSKDLQDGDSAEQSAGLGAYFGTVASNPVRRLPAKSVEIFEEPARIQLRDLVTRLLRSIYQRDSRRKFFPEGFWLMSSLVDMSGFIPAVVAEEERRHEVQESDDEDEGEFTYLTDEDTDSSRPFNAQAGMYAYHASRNMRQLWVMKEQRRARRMRQMELIAPRQEILRNLPFSIPFETRVEVFREFILRDQQRRRGGHIDPDSWRWSIAQSTTINPGTGQPTSMDILRRHRADIEREHVFSSAFDHFYDLGDKLKEPIQITFIDQFGREEAGIDGGGVTKEFLTSITKETFDPLNEEQLFVANDQNLLYPNPAKLDSYTYLLRAAGMGDGSREMESAVKDLLARYRFLGRIIGKCLYEGFLIDVGFAGYFLLQWALTGGTTSAAKKPMYKATVNDLHDLDEDLYRGILKLKNYDGNVEADFGLNFTVVDTFEIPSPTPSNPHNTETKSVTRPLKSNGAEIPVTNENRFEYIYLLADHRLRAQSWYQTNAFLSGLGEIIQPWWLSMFNQSELQRLVGGDSREIDVSDLRTNTIYSGLYDIGDDQEEHPTIKIFWDVLRKMDDQDRRKVLKFVTSTPRAPLLGFSHLNPRFSIRDSGSGDKGRLPTTSTCVNLLKLPIYGSAKVMRERLLYAVNSGAGFDLS